MKRKNGLNLICLIFVIAIALTACEPSVPKEKREINDLIIHRCSNAWHDMGFDELEDTDPKDCSWLYWQYDDKGPLCVINGEEAYFEWLPEKGYIIVIGKLFLLYDSDESLIGCYSDSNYKLYYSRSSTGRASLDLAHSKTNEAGFAYFFSNEAFKMTYLSLKSFDEYDFNEDYGYCKLTDIQTKRIK